MGDDADVERFIAQWRDTGGSELANTQSFINGLCRLLGVEPPHGSRTDDAQNDYVFERRVFQDNGDGTVSFGRIDCYKRGAFTPISMLDDSRSLYACDGRRLSPQLPATMKLM